MISISSKTNLTTHNMIATRKLRLLLFGLIAIFASFSELSAQDSIAVDSLANSGANRRNAIYFADGLKQRLAGNTEQAIKYFEQALMADSTDHASMYELSELYARDGRIGLAEQMMRKAVKLNPTNKWYQIRLAQVYKFQGNYEAYAEIYRKLLKKDPTNTDYFGELSSALLLLEKYDEAITVFEEIERQIGVNEMLSLQKQQIYLSIGKPKKAIEEIEKLAAAYPYEVRFQAMLAELYVKNGDKKKALETYKNIKALDPNDPYIHVSLYEYYMQEKELSNAFRELLQALANESLDIQTKLQIIPYWGSQKLPPDTLLNQARQIGEVLTRVHPENGFGYLMLADVYQDQKKFELALENYQAGLAIDSSVYRAWEGLLFAEMSLRKFNEIARDAERALKLFPEQPLPYLLGAFGYFDSKNFDRALQLLQTGQKLVYGNDVLLGEFYNYLAEVNHELGNEKESFEYYDKTLALNSENSTALNNYAYHLAVRGERLEKALEMAAKAVNLDPENASNLDTYAWVYFRMEAYEDALYWIKKALKQDSDTSGTILEHYGDILYKLNDLKKAMEYWKKAKDSGEASDLIDRKIEEGKYYE